MRSSTVPPYTCTRQALIDPQAGESQRESILETDMHVGIWALRAPPHCVKRYGSNLQGFDDFLTEQGSSQSHDLALTVLFVPNLLDSAPPRFTSDPFGNAVIAFHI